MKRLSIALLCLFAVACLATGAAAQVTPPSQLDKEIEAAEKRLNELKQQKRREELQKQIRSLQSELDGLNGSAAPSPSASPASGPSAAPAVVAAASPTPAASGPAGGPAGGGQAGGGAAPGAGNQADKKCLQAATGAITLNRFEQAACDLARDVVANANQLDPTAEESLLLTVLAGQLAHSGANAAAITTAVRDFVITAEPSRTDKQIGADPKSSGTTSLVVKGGIPSVLGWATEHGAAVASRDGTDVTFRFNPVGTIEALSGAGYISSYENTENDPVVKFLRSTSVGVTFDTTRGTDTPTLVGSKRQVSAVSFRYQFVNQRDPRNKIYRDKWAQFLSGAGIAFTNAASAALNRLEVRGLNLQFRNAALQTWLTDTIAAVNARQAELATLAATPVTGPDAAREEVRKIIEQRLAALPADALTQDSEFVNDLNGFLLAQATYTAKKNELLDEINKGTVVSFEYTNHREVNAPDSSNFRFIAERGTVGGIDLTANASLTIFNKMPVDKDAKRIKDFSFALQLDKRLKNTMGLGDSMLSFAGKFERAASNAVALDGTVLPNTKGDIAAGQLKLTIPLGDTGIKLPLSVTFANRTELVREKEVRGNFGFTLDFDSLFARFKPFTK
jgi:hypothetical protein